VSTYRKMRRHARLARRSGLQPMMLINAGELFPETLGIVLARAAWRYRSELAPVGVAAALMAAAWWLHHARPHWWPLLAVPTGVATWAVALFGARWRFPTLAERVYAAVTIYVGGIWFCSATAVGPFVPLLRDWLVIGGLILSVPWASLCRVVFARLHGIFGGTTGSGKSGGLNMLMGNLVACRDLVIWGIDLKRGMELGPWEPCIDRLATTTEEAASPGLSRSLAAEWRA